MTTTLKDGIYIGLPEEEYHAQPALSKSGIDKLDVSPLHYWHNSPMNPDYAPREKTPAMRLGSLRHKYFLERDVFFDSYAKMPAKSDYPDALFGADDLKDFMRKHKIKGLTATKPELIKAIRAAGHAVDIWDEILSEHGKAHAGKEFVSDENMRILEDSYMKLGANGFKDGLSEVSIFWTDKQTGIQLRVRLDYLKVGEIWDLKTFSNSQCMPIDKVVSRSIMSGRYHMQALMYNTGLIAMQDAYKKSGNAIAYNCRDLETTKIILEALAGPHPTFSFLFQASEAPYDIRIKDFRRVPNKEGATDNVYWLKAREKLRAGVDTYKMYLDHYGTKEWLPLHEIRSDIEDTELPWMMYE